MLGIRRGSHEMVLFEIITGALPRGFRHHGLADRSEGLDLKEFKQENPPAKLTVIVARRISNSYCLFGHKTLVLGASI